MSNLSISKEITLKFHSDSGHGWLEVPKAMARLHLRDKYAQISCCSYMQGDLLYLEEDDDAPLLIAEMQKAGITLKYEEIDEEVSPIRHYDGFMV